MPSNTACRSLARVMAAPVLPAGNSEAATAAAYSWRCATEACNLSATISKLAAKTVVVALLGTVTFPAEMVTNLDRPIPVITVGFRLQVAFSNFVDCDKLFLLPYPSDAAFSSL